MNNNYLKVKIEGHNVNNYLRWLIKEKINIHNINIINHRELLLTVNNYDYNKLYKYSKSYKINVVKKYGILRIMDIIKKNQITIVSLLFSVFFLYFLSNIIFSIDIISNNQKMIALITKELSKNNIKKYQFKKKYHELAEIKNNILKNNKDSIEWLEMTTIGTKYVIRFVERKQANTENGYNYQSIIANKDAIITEIHAYNGEKIKNINDYVNKDEIIISGILEQPNGQKIYNKAQGKVFGEVWYKVTIDYPYTYYEERTTGNHKNVLSFNFLNHQYPLIPYNKYRQFKISKKKLLTNELSIFNVSYETQYELKIIEKIYTQEEVISQAIKKAKEKITESNNKIIEIKDISILNKQDHGAKITLNLFFTVIEDITKIIEINKKEISNEIT